MITLVRYIGGSRLYNLATEDSDKDHRSIFIHNDFSKIAGLSCRTAKHDTIVKSFDGDDSVAYELRKWFMLMRKCSTSAIEAVFLKSKDYVYITLDFSKIRDERIQFIDSQKLITSTIGYAMGEKRLALGERCGKLGGKRRKQVEAYGFSPKNATQIIRIIVACESFLNNGDYALDISKYDTASFYLAKKIKTQPGKFTKDDVEKIIDDYIQRAREMKDNMHTLFNENLANMFLEKYYLKFMP